LPRERVVRAICHEEPDRVPVYEPYGVFSPTADVILGRPSIIGDSSRRLKMEFEGRYKEIRKAYIKDTIDLSSKLNFDVAYVSPPPYREEPKPEDRPNLIGEWTWSAGDSVYRFLPGSGVVKEIDSKIKSGGIPALKEYVDELEETKQADMEELHEGLDDFEKTLGRIWKKQGLLLCSAAGHIPMGASWFPLFLQCFYRNRDLMRRFLQVTTKRNIMAMKLAMDYGAELIYIHGDIACNHGPFISPDLYRELIFPEIKKEVDELHKRGAFAFNSSDGNLWPIIDDYLVNSNVDGMMEIQVTAGMDRRKLKERFGDRICFNGAVDCSLVLPYGSQAEVIRETKSTIDTLSPGGGHILCSTHSIHKGVKPENYLTMLQVARKYGQYGH